MTDLVDETLAAWRRGGHVWGQSDCMLSIGDYAAAAGYNDLTPRFRGTYDTEAEAHAHLDANGGIAGLIEEMGIPVTIDRPRRGDIVEVQGIAALCTGETYALRIERGVVEVAARFVEPEGVWRVG